MSTYGDIRIRLSKLNPGVDLEILDGWIIDRYQEILDQLPWQRLESHFTIQTAAEYNTGTVAVTKGSATITGAGTTWLTSMSGRIIRFAGAPEYYAFSYVSTTSGTLDRPYEGTTASGLSYQLNQTVYPLPYALREIRGVRLTEDGWDLSKISIADLNRSAPNRPTYGDPRLFALYMDQNTNPPVPQIELYPIPQNQLGLVVFGIAESTALTSSDTSSTVLPWVRPACLMAGVQADIARYLKAYVEADRMEIRFKELLQEMIRTESFRLGARPFQVADRFTRHRLERARRGYRRHVLP